MGSRHISSYRNGIEFEFVGKERRMESIFLYAGRQLGYKRYRRALPGCVKFRFKREDVYRIFGKPEKSSNGGGTYYGLPIMPWDRYRRADCCLHFQYHPIQGTITMITLMPPNWTPKGIPPRKTGAIQSRLPERRVQNER